jgi:hypothetical protein
MAENNFLFLIPQKMRFQKTDFFYRLVMKQRIENHNPKWYACG